MEKNKTNGVPTVGISRETHKKIDVEIYKREESIDRRIVGGKALLDVEKQELLFVQNKARGPRSREIARTWHARMVRRPDGEYTATFRFHPSEHQVRFEMIAEIRELVTKSEEDVKREAALAKVAENEPVNNEKGGGK